MEKDLVELALRHPLKMLGAVLGMVLFAGLVGYGIQNVIFPWLGSYEL